MRAAPGAVSMDRDRSKVAHRVEGGKVIGAPGRVQSGERGGTQSGGTLRGLDSDEMSRLYENRRLTVGLVRMRLRQSLAGMLTVGSAVDGPNWAR